MDILNISGLLASLVDISLSKSGEKPLVESFQGVYNGGSVKNYRTSRSDEAARRD
jgi:hypothetical protein